MRNMLNNVNKSRNTTKTIGNIKLEVSNTDDFTYFNWKYTVDSVDFELKQMSLRFSDWSLWFMNNWALYDVGNASVNVPKEAAIAIAKNATADLLVLHIKEGDVVRLMQVTLREFPVNTILVSGPREALTLYPLWHMVLYFDKTYSGYYGVAVDVWADTGQVYRTYPLSFLGAPTII